MVLNDNSLLRAIYKLQLINFDLNGKIADGVEYIIHVFDNNGTVDYYEEIYYDLLHCYVLLNISHNEMLAQESADMKL